MAEDIKPEVLKKTQAALNKYIKKPPLTDKLLRKPPFRFLHDIVTSVIRETGFLNGVFTPEELVAENVKDKDNKIKFLTKLISAVKDSTDNNIKAKPGKIVAGIEVDRTLELLQAIAKGISNQKNGNKSVQNNQNEKNKFSQDNPEVTVTNNKSNVIKEGQGKQKSPDVVKEKKKRGNGKEVIDNGKEKKKREKSENRGKSEKEAKQKPKEVKRKESLPSLETDSAKGLSNTEKQDNIKTPTLESTQPIEEPEQIINETLTEKITKQPSVELKSEDAINKEEIVFRHKEADKKEEVNIESNETRKDLNEETTSRRPSTRRSSSRSHKQPMKVIAEKLDTEKEKGDVKANENSNVHSGPDIKNAKDNDKDTNTEAKNIPPPAIERPRTARRAPPVLRPPSARPRSGRPPSARPGAPKTRDRGEVAIDQNKEKHDETKEVIVITENEKVEGDKEEMVVLEQQPLSVDEEDKIEDPSSNAAEGVLVDILKLENVIDKKKKKTQIDIEWEDGQKDKRETWQKECDRLRAGIQAMTRSTGPLGKLFDFLQEDVDLAARELSYWKEASTNHATQLVAEQRLTDETLSKHKKKLIELEGQIEEEQEAIRAVKSSILLNDRKILSLISRVPTSQ